jgi:hypothetical protein
VYNNGGGRLKAHACKSRRHSWRERLLGIGGAVCRAYARVRENIGSRGRRPTGSRAVRVRGGRAVL